MISVEHSNPPSEYFFDDPNLGNKTFKNIWLPKLQKAL